jgi:putative endonuclease
MRGVEKRIVYLIRSDTDASRHYVLITSNVRDRIDWNNHGSCGHTVSDRPWSLVVSLEFPTEKAARRVEKYLKSGSGRAFTKRHFGAAGTESTTARRG